jgi:hypothetical protein
MPVRVKKRRVSDVLADVKIVVSQRHDLFAKGHCGIKHLALRIGVCSQAFRMRFLARAIRHRVELGEDRSIADTFGPDVIGADAVIAELHDLPFAGLFAAAARRHGRQRSRKRVHKQRLRLSSCFALVNAVRAQ